MNIEPQQHRRPTLVWPQSDQEAIAQASELDTACYLDEDTVAIVLLQAIFRMPAENRRKILMFMHQAQDADRVATEMTIEPDGRVDLRLTYRER